MDDEECFYKSVRDLKPDFVIHTAFPFIEDVQIDQPECETKIKKYIKSTRLLARAAARADVRKIVMTGAATSIVGKEPKLQGIYDNSNEWVEDKDEARPNEKAKLGAERACWDEILKHQAEIGSSATRLTTILPYFISGPPLYKEAFNSSCRAISSIIDGS